MSTKRQYERVKRMNENRKKCLFASELTNVKKCSAREIPGYKGATEEQAEKIMTGLHGAVWCVWGSLAK